jgi:KaiC/GvpD/RAD55 family RecA-like ATPase
MDKVVINRQGDSYPYDTLVPALIQSVLSSYKELWTHLEQKNGLNTFDHWQINKHFSWLRYSIREGDNRHLFDAGDGSLGLATSSIRKKRGLPLRVREAFEAQGFPAGEKKDLLEFAQEGPTRISRLVIRAFDAFTLKVFLSSKSTVASDSKKNEKSVFLTSPLSVVFDFLIDPAVPNTQAYALVAIRNHLFFQFETSIFEQRSNTKLLLSASSIDTAVTHIWTSIRPRFNSKGMDKLPAAAKTVDGLVRHYLAARNLLVLHFKSKQSCFDYLSQDLISKQSLEKSPGAVSEFEYEFSKPPALEKLPETGQLVNELIGLPIPIRGGDILFRGGLKFSERRGLVMAIHGGPGSGKTSLALALATSLIPLGVEVSYLTAEETEQDLISRINSLIPDEIKRLSFFPKKITDHIAFKKFSFSKELDPIADLESKIEQIVKWINDQETASVEGKQIRGGTVQKPCRYVVVLDGLHDFFAVHNNNDASTRNDKNSISQLYRLVEQLKSVKALVILTAGSSWSGDSVLDYLVDVAIRVSHEHVDEFIKRPDRRLTLSKARHQLCSGGTHGFQIAGSKGVRFSPQISYMLDKRSIWKTRLPNQSRIKTILLASDVEGTKATNQNAPYIFDGSHVFLNGQGSGGKAALALKLALAPIFNLENGHVGARIPKEERVLIVSFLYPSEYYEHLAQRLKGRDTLQSANSVPNRSRIEVIHLYPGHLKPNDLYNRIDWKLEAADLEGDPFTGVIVDGIHNVFIQFPEIERYGLFWPQIFNMLRTREVMTIITHTTLLIPDASDPSRTTRIDDNRSEPLRHALVQKTDFQIEIDPYIGEDDQRQSSFLVSSDVASSIKIFSLRTLSAIGQPIPRGRVYWDRESLKISHNNNGR